MTDAEIVQQLRECQRTLARIEAALEKRTRIPQDGVSPWDRRLAGR